MLLSFDTASYVAYGSLFEKFGVIIMSIFPRPYFMYKGKKVNPTSTAYFVGNAENTKISNLIYLRKQEPTLEEQEDEETVI